MDREHSFLTLLLIIIICGLAIMIFIAHQRIVDLETDKDYYKTQMLAFCEITKAEKFILDSEHLLDNSNWDLSALDKDCQEWTTEALTGDLK